MNALYIHIPFCLSKCFYCSFSSFANQEEIHNRYVDALVKEIGGSGYRQDFGVLRSIFIGGGTPTILSEKQFDRIVETIHSCFHVESDLEFSIEANPENVSPRSLTSLRRLGVNRISFGVQTFVDDQLRSLGRIHNSMTAERAVFWARDSGFLNINIDLMYGLPGQDVRDHRYSIVKAMTLPISHISIYELTVEKNTVFANQLNDGKLKLPGDEIVADMDALTAKLTARAGFNRYEISNYCKDGFRCQHNMRYWKNLEYLGVGASAVSYLKGKRITNICDPLDYCIVIEEGKNPNIECEQLSKKRSLRETVIMGLRLVEGVSVEEIYDRYGVDVIAYYGEVLENLKRLGLVRWSSTHLYLTKRGIVYADRVLAELV